MSDWPTYPKADELTDRDGDEQLLPPARNPASTDPAIAEEVAICTLGGMTDEQIASGLRMSVDALRTRYGYALDGGANAIRSKILRALTLKALKGDAAASKMLLERAPKVALPPAGEDQPAAPEGKKAAANEAAKTAADGTDWGSLLKPPRVQ